MSGSGAWPVSCVISALMAAAMALASSADRDRSSTISEATLMAVSALMSNSKRTVLEGPAKEASCAQHVPEPAAKALVHAALSWWIGQGGDDRPSVVTASYAAHWHGASI